MNADRSLSRKPPEAPGILSWAAGLMGLTGLLLAVWPVVDSMNPAADVTTAVTVDLSTIAPGERLTVLRDHMPIFIVHRTPEQIAVVRADNGAAMPSPQPDAERVQRPEWLVVVGRPPVGYWLHGQEHGESVGNYGGWIDFYSTAHYDLSGRVREGWRVGSNLAIPKYYFLTGTILVIE